MANVSARSPEKPETQQSPLLDVRGLVKHFPLHRPLPWRPRPVVRAVDEVTFDVHEGETLGIVGESGCGKSTVARLLMLLLEPDHGQISFAGRPIGAGGDLSARTYRRQVQMVFQNSYASLNPRLPVEETLAFGPHAHGVAQREAKRRAQDLLAKVGLDPAIFGRRYAHELSGGQRQRVNIARALAVQPRVLLLDEAVSALDKSVQAQVLNLLIDLKNALQLTYVFISHDLDVVRFLSDRVMVMYLGKIVEIGPVDRIYGSAQHPYSQALLAARPSIDPRTRTQAAPLSGDPPSPLNPPSGCRFRTRCVFAESVCQLHAPALVGVRGAAGHYAACHMTTSGSGHSKAAAA